jgi:NAD+ kinase
MNNFYIITNETKDHGQKITTQIKNYLKSCGKACTDDLKYADCILVLGGDGTLLRAAVELAHIHVPFLGINLGNLGFLAEVDQNNLERALKQIINGEYSIEKRMMLNGIINDQSEIPGHSALNEVVIAGHKSMQLMYFDLYVNGLKLSSYVADGMIISTPTGSTGYNLSAGGPIVEPRAEAILLTPICSHSMRSRSIILSAEDEVMIEISRNKYGEEQTTRAIFDGHTRLPMKTGDRITIAKSEKATSLIKLSKTNFIEILQQKL